MFKAINDFAKKNPILTGAILILIAGLIVYFIGKKAGKAATPPLPTPVLGPTGSAPFNPGPLTDALARNIVGIAYTPRDEKPFQELLTLPDWQFIEVAKDWQNRYFQEDRLTLIQAIGAEKSWWPSFQLLRDQILQKAAKLQLV